MNNSNPMLKKLLEKIGSKDALVGVIGLGYVGLPLSRAFAEAGLRVLGFDLDEHKVDSLMKGKSYIEQIPSKWLRETVAEQRFSATTDFSRLSEPDVILICVPTPLTQTREPDMTYIVHTSESISAALRPGQLVVLESTTYPGTSREVVLPILERSGLRVGEDYFLAYSPEREDPGRKDYNVHTIPKVVGGLDEPSQRAAIAAYQTAIQTIVPVSSCEAAEAVKILENTYRCVNIALVNELKLIYDRMGIDVWEVINAAATKPFGFTPFYPGPGLGGHCIPIDPFYLSWKARQYGLATRFIELAGEVNISMPQFVVSKTMNALNEERKPLKGSKILILGLAYKKDIDDDRESPTWEIMELLLAGGAKVMYNDPHIPVTPPKRQHRIKMRSRPLTATLLESCDAVIICTDHSDYDYQFIVDHARIVIDTRNATKDVKRGRKKIVAS